METLSSSVSALNFSTPSHHEAILHHFKTSHILPPQTNLHSKANTKSNTNSLTQIKTQTLTTPSLSIPTNKTLLFSSSQTLHKSPASGYAAALLDIAQCSNMTLDLVNRDVRRLLQLIQTKNVEAVLESPFVGLEEKGLVMRMVAQKGRFNKVLVSLVKMLVRKSKVGIVKDVLDEFGRIYDQLSGVNHGCLGRV